MRFIDVEPELQGQRQRVNSLKSSLSMIQPVS
jgi:hypothetical protein